MYSQDKLVKYRAKSIIKTNPLFALGWLLFSVNNIPNLGDSLGKQVATLIMIGGGFLFLLNFSKVSLKLKNTQFILISIYAYYSILNNTINGLIDQNKIINDLAEPIRIIGFLLFFIVGLGSSAKISLKGLRIFMIIFSLISSFLLLGWLIGNFFSSNILYDLYITRGGRFSALFTSVNYVWAQTIVVISLGIFYCSHINSKKWFIPILAILISLVSLLLSGGRASIISALAGLIIIIFYNLKRNKKILKIITTIIFIILLSSLLFSQNSQIANRFDRTVNRIDEFIVAIQGGNLNQVDAYQGRTNHWSQSWDEINERLAFGHGSNKTGIGVLDNTYLMSLYRYGIVGLFLEILIYFSFLWLCVKQLRFNLFYSLPLAFLLAYLISGIATSPFYELKTPYLLAFLMGWFSSASPYIESRTTKTIKT